MDQVVPSEPKTYNYFDVEQLVSFGNQLLQLVATKYTETQNLIHPVVPKIEPGFIRSQLPQTAPYYGEPIANILNDTQNIVFPGSTLWCHPNFFAYYPANLSHPAVLAEIFATAFGTPGFLWICNPVQTELENVICDWLAQAFELPERFFLKNEGGGVISSTVSDSIFLSVNVAKRKKMQMLGIDERNPQILKLVAYYSKCSHSSGMKAFHLNFVPYQRVVPAVFNQEVGNWETDTSALEHLINEDLQQGLIPFFYGATWGSTATCSYDPIAKIGEICQKHGIWLNVDAAYAGPSWLIPEYRARCQGLEYADSIQINFAKLMLTGLSGCLTYVSNKQLFADNLSGGSVNFDIYKNKYSEGKIIEYKDWQISLGRKFNSLRFWWVIRSFGIKIKTILGIDGLQQNILTKVKLTRYFDNLVTTSQRWRNYTKSELTLATFLFIREDLEEQNAFNKKQIVRVSIRLYSLINEDTSKGFISAVAVDDVFFLRLVVCNHKTSTEHLDTFWLHVNQLADKLLNDN